ncbi:hypothetical protein J3R83DRAFT_9569 [Lanmaoa asiatica]|nr:hypothetical protein J3R83DRAFT_9569 [Lanmaoa asiatica]
MILSVFASSVVLAFAAIFHVVGHVLNITTLMVAGIDFEIACSIIMCNLLVVVTYAYRFLWHDDRCSRATSTSETDSDDFTRPTRQPALTLTAVETNSSILATQQFTTHITVQDRSTFIDI